REVAEAVALCLAGAALTLIAAGRPWASGVVSDPALPALVLRPSGRDVGSAAGALGLLGLAGVVALAATRRSGRIAVGMLLVLAGGAVVADAVAIVGRLATEVQQAAAVRTGVSRVPVSRISATPWPWVSLVGGILLVAAGGVTTVRGRRWAALSGRYDAPKARTAPVDRETHMWEVLDRGTDPTA
ncbi:MAG: Trp biosynthesis-associated membrane protein, partial [Actinomycetota bacterium]|nr:Trp biosynthesis-associated membrane protein [Actinomycetota bacterium]